MVTYVYSGVEFQYTLYFYINNYIALWSNLKVSIWSYIYLLVATLKFIEFKKSRDFVMLKKLPKQVKS